MLRRLVIPLLLFASRASAQVTVYATTGTAAAQRPTPCIGAVACDGSPLQPINAPANGVQFNNQIQAQLFSGGMANLSMQHFGHFAGFSLELSVANHLIGSDGTHINPIFMNLLGTITSRSGKIWLRVGGNTQDRATVIPGGLPNGVAIEKLPGEAADNTKTPTLLLSPGLIYAMGNMSQHVNIEWFLGVPFNDTQDPRLLIAEIGQAVLGDKLIGLQLGNEPDLYWENGIRAANYTPDEYNQDWGTFLNDYISDPNIKNNTQFLAPSVCCGGNIGWTPEQVFNTGFLDNYDKNLGYISVHHYPTDNCNGSGTAIEPQSLIGSTFLNHGSVQSQISTYLNSSQIAQARGKPFIMFETNTASCGGFSGVSDTFLAAQWAVDYALTLAYGNFSAAMFHVGGQSDFYNPFTPPATNQTKFREWSIGPIFYAHMLIAEAFGTSGASQVVDLFLNNNDQYTPGYAIYENGNPTRVVLINYLTDASGAHNYTANIAIGGGTTGQAAATPFSVQVKYLLAPSVTEKWNISWGGQTFGGPFSSDGRLQGSEMIYTFACANGVCPVTMPAPSVAIVYLTSNAFSESEPTTTATFGTTTTATGAANTASVAQAVLQTSNGRGGGNWEELGSTSFGSITDGARGLYDSMSATAIYSAISIFAGFGLLWGLRL